MNQKEQVKAEIAEVLSRRSGQYTHAVIRAALALDSNGQWKNCITSVQLSDGEPIKSRSLPYSGFEIHVAVEKPKKILGLVEDLVTKGKFRIAKRVILLEHGRFDSLGYGQQVGCRVSSSEAWIRSEWPGDQYLFTADREINPPSKPLISAGPPTYPDGYAAIEHLLGMDARDGRTWNGGVYFFFPDYRARIDSVTLGTQSLSIKIGLQKSELRDLVGKVYAKSREGVIQQRDVEFLTSEERLDIGFQPEHAYVGLLCKSDGQTLDQWDYSPFRHSSRTTRVEEFTLQYVRQLINQGEGSHVEFKLGVREDKDKKEMAESAIAFTNKNGGVILVGVDDNARIQGVFGDDLGDSIVQSLRDRCEPPVEPVVRRVVLEDKPVYAVQILESNNKPHLLRGTGVVYIRIGGTDKPATRYELDELFNRNRGRLDF